VGPIGIPSPSSPSLPLPGISLLLCYHLLLPPSNLHQLESPINQRSNEREEGEGSVSGYVEEGGHHERHAHHIARVQHNILLLLRDGSLHGSLLHNQRPPQYTCVFPRRGGRAVDARRCTPWPNRLGMRISNSSSTRWISGSSTYRISSSQWSTTPTCTSHLDINPVSTCRPTTTEAKMGCARQHPVIYPFECKSCWT
jgi:hypothetical protein